MRRIWDKVEDCWVYAVDYSDMFEASWTNPHGDPVLVCVQGPGELQEWHTARGHKRAPSSVEFCGTPESRSEVVLGDFHLPPRCSKCDTRMGVPLRSELSEDFKERTITYGCPWCGHTQTVRR